MLLILTKDRHNDWCHLKDNLNIFIRFPLDQTKSIVNANSLNQKLIGSKDWFQRKIFPIIKSNKKCIAHTTFMFFFNASKGYVHNNWYQWKTIVVFCGVFSVQVGKEPWFTAKRRLTIHFLGVARPIFFWRAHSPCWKLHVKKKRLTVWLISVVNYTMLSETQSFLSLFLRPLWRKRKQFRSLRLRLSLLPLLLLLLLWLSCQPGSIFLP